MIPQNDGAIAMADLTLTRAQPPEIKELAKNIKASQTQENARMRVRSVCCIRAILLAVRSDVPWARA